MTSSLGTVATVDLEPTTLERIKAALLAMASQDGALARADIVRLAGSSNRILIDRTAVAELGQPLVIVQPGGEPTEFRRLTPRQAEVARLAARGFRNREIAHELHISVATVKDHMHAILTSLDLTTRSEIAGLYLTQG